MNLLDLLKQFFDEYGLQARVFPALIATAPLILLLAAVIPWRRLSWMAVLGSGSVGTVAVVIVLSVMAAFAREQGIASAAHLFPDGRPSTVILRYSDHRLDAVTKSRAHRLLAPKLGMKAPTPEEEAANPKQADEFYDAAGGVAAGKDPGGS